MNPKNEARTSILVKVVRFSLQHSTWKKSRKGIASIEQRKFSSPLTLRSQHIAHIFRTKALEITQQVTPLRHRPFSKENMGK